MRQKGDDTAVESPDLSDEFERLERAQRNLSRKEPDSNNWKEQHETVIRRHAELNRKHRNFLHDRSAYYARMAVRFVFTVGSRSSRREAIVSRFGD